MGGVIDGAEHAARLEKLGKLTNGKGCLYTKKLFDVDLAVLERLQTIHWDVMNKLYPC